jgi:hypothetical protein
MCPKTPLGYKFFLARTDTYACLGKPPAALIVYLHSLVYSYSEAYVLIRSLVQMSSICFVKQNDRLCEGFEEG